METPVAIVKDIVRKFLAENNIQESVNVPVQMTRDEFEGEVTIASFPLAKTFKKSPQEIASIIKEFIESRYADKVKHIEVKGGFVNISFSDSYWLEFIKTLVDSDKYPVFQKKSETVVIEFSSPNTNKPQHLGHVRNNVLGWATAMLLKRTGTEKVIKVNLINDRGIHISKSMLAWLKWGNGITPEKAGKKGDHLIGDFYVMFEKEYKKQVEELMNKGMSKEEAMEKAPLMQEARELLRRWESGDPEVLKVWRMLNDWVLKGFDETYKRLGIEFDHIDYESETYKLGKEIVREGLEKGIFYQKEDGSVWIDLTDVGLDHKLLLRSDGTSVYITQDLGTIELRWNRYKMDLMIYVVAEEQEYHFKVLQAILKKLGRPYADKIYHLSYAMVDLPTGKMKSREGTVIDADDLLDELHQLAYEKINESPKTASLSEEEKHDLAEKIALGAIKFYMLRVDPKKRILFRKEEALDFEGYTGPFVQYTHARIVSLWEKAQDKPASADFNYEFNRFERQLLKLMAFYGEVLQEATRKYDPSALTNFLYRLAKEFNRYYANTPIVKETDSLARSARLLLSRAIQQILNDGASTLGIPLPDKM